MPRCGVTIYERHYLRSSHDDGSGPLTRARRSLKRARTRYIIKIAVPIVLLTNVFTEIDLGILLTNVLELDFVVFVSASVLTYFSNVFLLTLRWKMILFGSEKIDGRTGNYINELEQTGEICQKRLGTSLRQPVRCSSGISNFIQ